MKKGLNLLIILEIIEKRLIIYMIKHSLMRFSMTCNFLWGSKIIGKIVKPLLDIESHSNDQIGYNREKRNNLYDKTHSDAFQHK